MQVIVQRVTDVKPTRDKKAAESEYDTEACMAFIELQALGTTYVSPVAAQGSAPEFDWAFYIPVDEQPTQQGAVKLRFLLRNFLARKQPQVRHI